MRKETLRSMLPYVVGLAVAAVLYVLAGRIEYTPRPGLLGPDTWPKMAIALMGIACLVEIVKKLMGWGVAASGIEAVLEQDDGQEESPRRPWLLAGGIGLVTAYAVLVPVLGFLLASFLFLVVFMYLGGYRRHFAVWSISAFVIILVALLFLRFAYVSLPRGEPPFDHFTDFVRALVGG
jgi:putative tricarboxylic transport membrane protein